MKKVLIVLLFLFTGISFPLFAQEDEEEMFATNSCTMIGLGGYNLRDTYLSPSTDINYTGWMARVMNERMKLLQRGDGRISRQHIFNIEFGYTENGAGTAAEYAGFADYSLGYHYRWEELLPGLKVMAGASGKLSAGFIYNPRNSNNPVSGKCDLDLNLSAIAIYDLHIKGYPVTLRYQTDIPFMGLLFSIHKGEPYYYLSQIGAGNVVSFSSLHNKFAMKNLFTADFPIRNFTLRAGYMNNIYRTHINKIHTHVISNAFMIGVVKEFVAFGGKKAKQHKHKFNSAYY